jgi:hypothetical protein
MKPPQKKKRIHGLRPAQGSCEAEWTVSWRAFLKQTVLLEFEWTSISSADGDSTTRLRSKRVIPYIAARRVARCGMMGRFPFEVTFHNCTSPSDSESSQQNHFNFRCLHSTYSVWKRWTRRPRVSPPSCLLFCQASCQQGSQGASTAPDTTFEQPFKRPEAIPPLLPSNDRVVAFGAA